MDLSASELSICLQVTTRDRGDPIRRRAARSSPVLSARGVQSARERKLRHFNCRDEAT